MFVLQTHITYFLGLLLCCNIEARIVTIEAETYTGSFPKHYRSEASGFQTVWLHRSETLKYDFCLIRRTTVSVADVRFSNDGGPDSCGIAINGEFVGSIQSSYGSNYGHLWNVFKSSNPFGSIVVLNPGSHTISLNVTSADYYGIEIDKFDFSVSDEEMNDDIFSCSLPCIQNLPTVFASKSGLSPGKAVQKSYTTQCAEEDNVNVAVFNTDVKKFEILASSPLYITSKNLRNKNTANCPFLTPVYWLYEHIIVSPTTGTHSSNTSHLYFSQKPAPNPEQITKMAVTFTLKGRKSGYIDSEIGSRLFMTMASPEAPAEVTVSYKHRNGSSIEFPAVQFTETQNNYVWNIPDFTWKEDLVNNILLEVKSTVINQELINFRLERRYMEPDQVIQLYSSDLIIVEGIKVDFWWQAPESMQLVRTSTGDTWDNIAYFRIYYTRQPVASGFSQIFVLYQDGNMRLLNPPSPVFDWIPFGTSVIIGQTNVDDFRPAVSITRVDIEPQDLTMVVTYQDGSKVSMDLVPGTAQTKLNVHSLDLKKNTAIHPFATFRSMYVQAGNSDSDSLVSDVSDTKKILGGSWTEIPGTTFLIYRRCESKHLTQSPDVMLTVTET